MKNYRFATLLFACTCTLASLTAYGQAARAPYAPGTTLTVTASKLSLRDAPSTAGSRILTMPRGQKVVVLEDSTPPVPFESEGEKGYWARIQIGDKTGYAFDGFMKPSTEKPMAESPTTTPPENVSSEWVCVPGERVGPITYETSLADLKKLFGAENVSDGKFYLGEGESEPATILFKGEKDQLTITWSEMHVHPATITIDGPGTRWRTESGITIGTPLDTLEEMNGAPIHFTGFEWDYAGAVVDWKGGRLSGTHPLGQPFSMTLNVEPTDSTQDAYLSLMGDDVFTSDMPAARMVKPHVFSMTIGLLPAKAPVAVPAAKYHNALSTLPAPEAGETRYVLATSLNMREEPKLDAPIVGRLAYGSEVSIAATDGERVPLSASGMNGHWVKIKSADLEGYVFDAFLLPFPAPPNPTTGLWHFADTSLGKDGAEQLKSEGTPGSGASHIVQPYKYGARIDYINKRVENSAQRETRLTMKGIAPEHAFLIAQRCIEGLGDMPFAMGDDGRLLLRTPKSTVWILSSAGGSVAISDITRFDP